MRYNLDFVQNRPRIDVATKQRLLAWFMAIGVVEVTWLFLLGFL